MKDDRVSKVPLRTTFTYRKILFGCLRNRPWGRVPTKFNGSLRHMFRGAYVNISRQHTERAPIEDRQLVKEERDGVGDVGLLNINLGDLSGSDGDLSGLVRLADTGVGAVDTGDRGVLILSTASFVVFDCVFSASSRGRRPSRSTDMGSNFKFVSRLCR